MNKRNWLVKQDEVKGGLGVEIWNALLLADHPVYQSLFDKYKMPHKTQFYTRPAIVKSTFGRVFNPMPEFFRSGTLGKCLCAQMGIGYTPFADRIGNMRRFGEEGDQYHIAFECADGKLSLVDIFTVLFEYGHYVEQRAAHKLGAQSGKFTMRKTSFYPAILIHGYRDGLDQAEKNQILCSGDKLSAYVNAYWLAWLFGIDLRNWISGIVMDEITMMDDADSFFRNVLLEIGDYIMDREYADKLFLSAGEYALDCLKSNANIDELGLCLQIDKASYILLIRILEFADKNKAIKSNSASK